MRHAAGAPAVQMLAVAILAFFAGVALWGTAQAYYAYADDYGSHGGCSYSGITWLDTNASGGKNDPYAYSQTDDTFDCNDMMALNVYFIGHSNCLWGWQSSDFLSCALTTTPVINVYGYHQIQKPFNSNSTTLETHAY